MGRDICDSHLDRRYLPTSLLLIPNKSQVTIEREQTETSFVNNADLNYEYDWTKAIDSQTLKSSQKDTEVALVCICTSSNC